MDSLFTTGNPSSLLWAGKDKDSFAEDKDAYKLNREAFTSEFEPNKWEYTDSVVVKWRKKMQFLSVAINFEGDRVGIEGKNFVLYFSSGKREI